MNAIHRTRSASSFTVASVLFGLVALTACAPAFADGASRQKTTGSHIARDTTPAGGEVRLEEVEVMIGAVRDARGAAREAREDASSAPMLPVLGNDAFLGDAESAAQPR